MELQKESYERLEYLGDAVLKLPIRHYLYTRYPNENEGYMTKLHIHIENKKSLAELAKSLNFGKYFVISKQIDNLGGRNMDRIHEDVFEAFLGALYLNGGFEICFEFIINLLETRIDYGEKLYQDVNYKDRLMKYYHQNNQEVPKYCYLHHYGPPYKRLYYMGVKKDNNGNDNIDNCFSFGYGSTKKQAEQNAAKMALILLKQLNDDQYNEQDIFYLTEKDIEKMKIEEENNNNNNNNI
jgi:ribonuclease-3